MYTGEVTASKKILPSLLRLAQTLKVSGLTDADTVSMCGMFYICLIAMYALLLAGGLWQTPGWSFSIQPAFYVITIFFRVDSGVVHLQAHIFFFCFRELFKQRGYFNRTGRSGTERQTLTVTSCQRHGISFEWFPRLWLNLQAPIALILSPTKAPAPAPRLKLTSWLKYLWQSSWTASARETRRVYRPDWFKPHGVFYCRIPGVRSSLAHSPRLR